jgi:two-component system, OmpR family, response regulator
MSPAMSTAMSSTAAIPAPPTVSMLVPQGQHRLVLLVESDPGLAELLGLLIAADGYGVLRARSADEAVALARVEPPDVILLDLTRPDADGPALLARLQAGKELALVPVILVSSRPIRPGAGDPVVGVLAVPVDAMELDRLLHRTLSPASQTGRADRVLPEAA